jgi:hypothetical protein
MFFLRSSLSSRKQLAGRQTAAFTVPPYEVGMLIASPSPPLVYAEVPRSVRRPPAVARSQSLDSVEIEVKVSKQLEHADVRNLRGPVQFATLGQHRSAIGNLNAWSGSEMLSVGGCTRVGVNGVRLHDPTDAVDKPAAPNADSVTLGVSQCHALTV